MKHISVIIKEMMNKGTLPPSQKVSKSKPKITILQAEALIYKVFFGNGKDDVVVLNICSLISEALKYIEHEMTELISVRDVVSCINGITYIISKDEDAAETFAIMFLEAYIDSDLDEAVSNYLNFKNKLLKEND